MDDHTRDEFFRRYATSPIHVPRLERLLAVYEADGENDAFCRRFIEWDRACPDGEAARIVAEILSAGDASGHITRYGDDAVRGAIRWMSGLTSLPVAERAQVLRARLSASDAAAVATFVDFLAGADALAEEDFRAAAAAWAAGGASVETSRLAASIQPS
jgi:hypothetical protein